MIVTFYGPDSYGRTQKLRELLDVYRGKHEHMDLFSADLDEDPEEWEKARDFLIQPSMFVQSKVAVLRNVTLIKDKEWVEFLKSQLEQKGVVLLISLPKAPPKKFEFLIKSPAKAQEFGKLEGQKLRVFVQKELKDRKLELAPDAERFFLEHLAVHDDCGWRVANELNKLVFSGFSQPVSRHDLELLIPWIAREEMYRTTKRLLLAKDIGGRLRALEELLLREESADHVFNLLAYQAGGQDVVALSDYDVAKKSGKLDYEECLLEFALNG